MENNIYATKTIEELQKMRLGLENLRNKEEHKNTPLRRKLIMNNKKENSYHETVDTLNKNLDYLNKKIELCDGIQKQQHIFKKSAVELDIIRLKKKTAYFLKPADRTQLEKDLGISDESMAYINIALAQVEKRIEEINSQALPEG